MTKIALQFNRQNSKNVPICIECDYHVVVDRQKE